MYRKQLKSKALVVLGIAALLATGTGYHLVRAEEHEDYSKVIQALPSSKQTLTQGIQIAAKFPEAAISAKFELDNNGKLSLSVYTVGKGLSADAENNVLKELAASPETDQWNPGVEVFKDVPHVSRASQQLTLMSLSPYSLVEIISKAQKDQPGTVFSIMPVLYNHKAQFEVLVAAQGKTVELHYDLMTGKNLKSAK